MRRFHDEPRFSALAQAQDAWEVLRIQAEFVEGFDRLASLGPCVSIFGGSRETAGSTRYLLAEAIAERLSRLGLGVITGGGPGAMEAGNRGAHGAGGYSIGMHINLPGEFEPNQYIDRDRLIEFRYFFVRKVMLLRYAQAYIFMPGGFGTLDELFEALTLIQTLKIQRFPIILMDGAYWEPLMGWLKNHVLEQGYLSPGDLDLFRVLETAEDVEAYIQDYYGRNPFSLNF